MAGKRKTRRRGTITQRGPDQWLVRVTLGYEAGKQVRINRVVRGAKQDADRMLTKLTREADEGLSVRTSRQSLGEWLTEWLDAWCNDVRERTRRDYRWLLDRYVPASLASKKLEKLSPTDIQRWVNDLSAGTITGRTLSARTVRYAHSVVRAALNRALRIGRVGRNVATLVDLPRQQRKELAVLSIEEAKRFLAVAAEERGGALLTVLLLTGLRPSEALALKWTDLEIASGMGVLRVRRSLVRVTGGAWDFAEPKTSKARRAIVLTPREVKMLERQRRDQLEEKLRLGPDYTDFGIVFATETGTPFSVGNVRRRFLARVTEKAGLPAMRLYDLRHSAATLLLALGVHPKLVAERLGHATTRLTLDTYSHMLPEMHKPIADQLAHALG